MHVFSVGAGWHAGCYYVSPNMKLKPLFKARAVGAKHFPLYSEATESVEPALAFCRQAIADGATSAVILRDSQGKDHPDNAGKFFLHQIVK